MEQIIEAIRKQYEFPKYMNKAQAAKYMNVSYNTMMQKYVPNGLKLIIVDGVVRISQDECDRFYGRIPKNKRKPWGQSGK